MEKFNISFDFDLLFVLASQYKKEMDRYYDMGNAPKEQLDSAYEKMQKAEKELLDFMKKYGMIDDTD